MNEILCETKISYRIGVNNLNIVCYADDAILTKESENDSKNDFVLST